MEETSRTNPRRPLDLIDWLIDWKWFKFLYDVIQGPHPFLKNDTIVFLNLQLPKNRMKSNLCEKCRPTRSNWLKIEIFWKDGGKFQIIICKLPHLQTNRNKIFIWIIFLYFFVVFYYTSVIFFYVFEILGLLFDENSINFIPWIGETSNPPYFLKYWF